MQQDLTKQIVQRLHRRIVTDDNENLLNLLIKRNHHYAYGLVVVLIFAFRTSLRYVTLHAHNNDMTSS